MELTQDDVIGILKLLEKSEVDYLEVQVGDMRLVASRSGALPGTAPVAPLPSAPPAASAPPPASVPAVAPERPAGAGATVSESAPPPGRTDLEGLISVPAPMVGIFHATPAPGEPPFVKVGTQVEPGSTLGLIEVMKVFNSINADVAGVVVEILVESGEFVEFGQPLFHIKGLD